jgi:hypothetical protein
MVGLIGLAIFAVYLLKFLNSKLNPFNSYLLTLFVVSIPLLQHVGYIVEPSIWTALAWSGLCLFFSFGEKNEENFYLWFFILSIASLMRASAFVAIVPLTLYWIYDSYIRNGSRFLLRREFYFAFIPLLIMIPFTLKSVLFGTPATEGELSKLALIMSSFKNFFPAEAAANAIMYPWVLFFPLGFLQFGSNKRILFCVKCIFFLLAYLVFYSINPGLWGISRYQSEFILPFVITGFLYFLFLIDKHSSKLASVILILLIGFNFYTSWNFQSYSKLGDESIFGGLLDGRTAGISERVYDTDQALKFAKDKGLLGATFVDGITYGQMPQIIAGVSYPEYKMVHSFGSYWGSADLEKLNVNPKVRVIILSDWEPNHEKIKKLTSLGWINEKNFYNERYKTTTYFFVRKN